MAKVTSKSRSSGGGAVRQTRGPGMNLGLKKPRHGKFPNPGTEKPTKSGTKTASGREAALPDGPVMSYLGRTDLPSAKRRRK